MAASIKRLTVKQVIAQLNNDEDDNIDDSGHDIDENDDSDEDMIAGALSQDDGEVTMIAHCKMLLIVTKAKVTMSHGHALISRGDQRMVNFHGCILTPERQV